jgi:drug/metabolite transporter (DMT)-like permease
MKKNPMKGVTLLLIGSFIWGTTFVAQSMGTNHLNAFSFNCIRNFIGVFALIPVLLWQICIETKNMNTVHNSNSCASSPITEQNSKNTNSFAHLSTNIKSIFNRDLFLGGLACGTALCLASYFQQLGIESSTVGKSAFITTLYIVLVPLLGLFFKKKLPLQIWCGVILAMIGLYMLFRMSLTLYTAWRSSGSRNTIPRMAHLQMAILPV